MGRINSGVALGLVMIAIAFIIFPIVLDGANEILTHANVSNYTGLEEIAAIGPLIVFVGLLFGGIGIAGTGAYRSYKRRRK